MKGHIVSSFFLMGIFAACTTTVKQTTEPVDYAAMVNPFIGTDFTGNTYPGAQAPFGMVQLSPDNGLGGWNRISGYYYPDSTIASVRLPASVIHIFLELAQAIYMIFLLCL